MAEGEPTFKELSAAIRAALRNNPGIAEGTLLGLLSGRFVGRYSGPNHERFGSFREDVGACLKDLQKREQLTVTRGQDPKYSIKTSRNSRPKPAPRRRPERRVHRVH